MSDSLKKASPSLKIYEKPWFLYDIGNGELSMLLISNCSETHRVTKKQNRSIEGRQIGGEKGSVRQDKKKRLIGKYNQNTLYAYIKCHNESH